MFVHVGQCIISSEVVRTFLLCGSASFCTDSPAPAALGPRRALATSSTAMEGSQGGPDSRNVGPLPDKAAPPLWMQCTKKRLEWRSDGNAVGLPAATSRMLRADDATIQDAHAGGTAEQRAIMAYRTDKSSHFAPAFNPAGKTVMVDGRPVQAPFEIHSRTIRKFCSLGTRETQAYVGRVTFNMCVVEHFRINRSSACRCSWYARS
jgi:hypothetical protein